MTHRKPDLAYERALWAGGYRAIAGVDEAGRGALAGPVAVAAVILPVECDAACLPGVRDSKQMSAVQRACWAERIEAVAVGWAVGYASAAEIDRWGIVPAIHQALRRALAALWPQPDFLLLDYLRLPDEPWPQAALVRGDQRALSIAAASVLAKTHRDALMAGLETRYPGYGFGQHKGYGTRGHRQALRRLGPSAVHRRSFRLLG